MVQYRAAVESILGPLSTQALASQTFGIYVGMVYFTPMIGGWIADRWLGATKTVMIGALLMTLGHFAMAFDQSFLIALVLLVLGSGCLKGNIAAQVGPLYRPDEVSRSSRGYTIFSTGINIGSIFGPLLCGLLAQVYGWHYGFGAAGVFMLFACAVYWMGRDYLPVETISNSEKAQHQALTKAEWRTLRLLVIISLFTVLQSISYDQTYNVGMMFIADHVDLSTPMGVMPVGWFISINALASVLCVPALLWWWKCQADRGIEPNDLYKMAMGAFFIALGVGMFALASLQLETGKAGLFFPVVANILTGIGFMMYWPMLLAIVARCSPSAIRARMMAMVYLTAFASGISSGYVGTYYQQLGPFWFWMLNASLAIFSGIMFYVFGKALIAALNAATKDNLSRTATLGVERFHVD
jgi:POT family proton-dependent oligopeptide transporter